MSRQCNDHITLPRERGPQGWLPNQNEDKDEALTETQASEGSRDVPRG